MEKHTSFVIGAKSFVGLEIRSLVNGMSLRPCTVRLVGTTPCGSFVARMVTANGSVLTVSAPLNRLTQTSIKALQKASKKSKLSLKR